MAKAKAAAQGGRVRGQTEEANSLQDIARQTARLWRKHHLTYDQSKHIVEHARRELHLEAPKARRRTVDRLGRPEVDRLIEAAYTHSSRYGFMIKMLFYTGARVSEFVQFRVEDLHLMLDPPQVYIAHAKGGSDGYVPILPALAQELRTHLNGRRNGYVFESNRSNQYTTRYVQRLVHDAHSGPESISTSLPTVCALASRQFCWTQACRWTKYRSFSVINGLPRRKSMPRRAYPG